VELGSVLKNPGINSRAEIVPSPRAYTPRRAPGPVGSGIKASIIMWILNIPISENPELLTYTDVANQHL
jgi:hypothetical protein